MAWHKIGLRHSRRYLWILFLWLMFTIGCFLAPFIAILIPFLKNVDYIQRFVRAADRLCAAMLGYDGKHMLSTELAHSSRLKWMYRVLNYIQPNHCEESAYEEGAYCRISDRRIGSR